MSLCIDDNQLLESIKTIWTNIEDLKSDSNVKKIFTKSKFSPALFEKIPSFVCLVFKIENK